MSGEGKLTICTVLYVCGRVDLGVSTCHENAKYSHEPWAICVALKMLRYTQHCINTFFLRVWKLESWGNHLVGNVLALQA